jgi:hypothetical protein
VTFDADDARLYDESLSVDGTVVTELAVVGRTDSLPTFNRSGSTTHLSTNTVAVDDGADGFVEMFELIESATRFVGDLMIDVHEAVLGDADVHEAVLGDADDIILLMTPFVTGSVGIDRRRGVVPMQDASTLKTVVIDGCGRRRLRGRNLCVAQRYYSAGDTVCDGGW